MKDILTDQFIQDGDIHIGRSNEQHQHHIIIATKGEYKQHPEVGVGIEQMLHDDQYDAVLIEAKKQLEYDGMTIDGIRFLESDLFIDGKYKK